MKKSLLALAVIAVAASANAATVYDKDGTTLGINGRIQSVYYSGNYNAAGENDGSIQNSARFGLEGRTQITDWVAGIGYAQWDMDSNSSGNGTKAREQYVGADFGEYGQLIAGKFRDSSYYAENVTDHYEDAAGTVQGNFNGARRAGQIMYTYDNYGFHGQLGFQTAQDDVPVFANNAGKKWNKGVPFGDQKFDVDSGFNAALGYTFDDVLFGPLSLRTGYSYLKGQKGADAIAKGDTESVLYTPTAEEILNNDPKVGTLEDRLTGTGSFKNFKHVAVGASWGNLDSGFYVAALYDYAKMKGIGFSGYDTEDGSLFKAFDDNEYKVKGYELSAGYAFDNGVSFLVGYEKAKYSFKFKDLDDGTYGDGSFKVKRIPVFVNYKINSNFNVWAEAGFNAGSNHSTAGIAKKIDHQVWSVGARYTF